MAKKILMIDDEPGFIKPIRGILEISGFKSDDIIYCPQIDEGLRALEMEKDIVCVSLDMLMADPMNLLTGEGEINGLKLLKLIRQKYPQLPIVCFTILRELEGGIKEAVEASNAKFISKTDANSVEKLIDFFKGYYGQA